jgi:hypothetical protein
MLYEDFTSTKRDVLCYMLVFFETNVNVEHFENLCYTAFIRFVHAAHKMNSCLISDILHGF